jgi:hypothetical protein
MSTPSAVAVHAGFYEHIFRLLCPYEDKVTVPVGTVLSTILPSGIVETRKELVAEPTRALFSYQVPQTISKDVVEENNLTDSPYVWQREDGTYGLAWIWAVKYNDQFKKEYETSTTNPTGSPAVQQAMDEFRPACKKVLKIDDDTPCPECLYCHRKTKNDKPAYVGSTVELLQFLQTNPDIMKAMNILELTENGFIAGVVDGKGKTNTKQFTMPMGEHQYVLYTKLGWSTMACVTPLDQFLDGREFN